MATPFIGQIIIFAGDFTIKGYAMCNGQLMPINQNTALFSILGTNYGGNGITTFALPNLTGRFPLHFGQGAGLTNRVLGEISGEENHTLTSAEMPAHTHTANAVTTLKASTSAANSGVPTANVAANTGRNNIYQSAAPNVNLAAGAAATSVTVNNTGGAVAHNNMPPYLALNFLIALNGIFPSRS
jgi:microcystin-dependent protein